MLRPGAQRGLERGIDPGGRFFMPYLAKISLSLAISRGTSIRAAEISRNIFSSPPGRIVRICSPGSSLMFWNTCGMAYRLARSCTERTPTHYHCFVYLAIAASELGRQEEARGAVQRVLEIYPKFTIKRHMSIAPFRKETGCRPGRRIFAPRRPAGVSADRRPKAREFRVRSDWERLFGEHDVWRVSSAGAALPSSAPARPSARIAWVRS